MSATLVADVDTIDTSLAARIRHLRATCGLTLDALAQQAGVSRAMLSRVERGESSPTAQLLTRLCNGLGITLAALFADGPASPLARRADQATWCDPASGYLRRAVSPRGTGSGVLDGVLELVLDGAPVRLGAGDCLWMPLDRPLRFHNPTARPVRYLVAVGRRRRPSFASVRRRRLRRGSRNWGRCWRTP